LRIMTSAGVLISAIGFLLACFFITRRLLGIEIAQTGFTTLVTLMLFLGGIQLMAIGLLGEYLARIYDEVKRRPLFIVKDAEGFEKHKEAGA
jgi:glycosyltransferase involved in cell wall biosynthesis